MSLPVTVALDWSLNTNHTGFVVSKAMNYYTDEGLDVSLIFPEGDYKPPADLVRSASATFGICPSETVISSNTQTRFPPLRVMGHLPSELIFKMEFSVYEKSKSVSTPIVDT